MSPVLKRAFQLAMSVATAVAGLVLALGLARDGDTAAFGWVLAALGALGAVASLLIPQPGGRGANGPR
jgi:hypothetical protein